MIGLSRVVQESPTTAKGNLTTRSAFTITDLSEHDEVFSPRIRKAARVAFALSATSLVLALIFMGWYSAPSFIRFLPLGIGFIGTVLGAGSMIHAKKKGYLDIKFGNAGFWLGGIALFISGASLAYGLGAAG